MSNQPRVLFVCIENACRSQMAAGFARLHGGTCIAAYSAGSTPADAVNPRAVAFMAERGCDLSGERPKALNTFADEDFDVVITMGCGNSCPWIPARIREDWALPDPRHLSDARFRDIRDDIERRVLTLLGRLGAGVKT